VRPVATGHGLGVTSLGVAWARLGATLEVFHDDGSLAQGG
jgi:hypothetical protein